MKKISTSGNKKKKKKKVVAPGPLEEILTTIMSNDGVNKRQSHYTAI